MERNALSLSLSLSLTHTRAHARAPTGLIVGVFLLLRPTAHLAQRPDKHTRSLTHLSDLVQQFVVLLPFLQGAQIATHPSCQGNGAVVPLECACFFLCVLCCLSALCVCERVCELPSGAGTHSGSSSLGSPAPLRHPRVLRDAVALVPNAHQAELDVRACVRLCLFVGILSAPETNT